MSALQALIIEDEQALVAIYERVLRDRGFEIRVARDGEEALEVLEQTTPQLIFLDMRLPLVNGMQVLRYIVNQPRLQHSAVIVVSSSKEFERDIVIAPNARFLQKPIMPSHIHDIAEQVKMAHH